MTKDDKPYEPKHKGFDEETTRRAQATAERAQKVKAGHGEYADQEYVEAGPQEAARRQGESREDVESSVERARKQAKR
jgi:hypothetical protein